jgi:hypothetical protein
LKEISIKYARSRPAFARWLKRLFLASLTGAYPHTRSAPVPPELREAYAQAFRDKPTAAWCDWLAHHGYLLFYVLKEFVVFAAPSEPALHAAANMLYNWDEFEVGTREAMDSIRSVILNNARKRQRADIFAFTEVELCKRNAQQLKTLYKIPRPHTTGRIHELLAMTRQAKYEARADDPEATRRRIAVDPQLRAVVHDYVLYGRRLLRLSHLDSLRLCGLSDDGAALWAAFIDVVLNYDCSQNTMLWQIARLGDDDFAVVNAFYTALYDVTAVKLFRLPFHWYGTRQYGGGRHSSERVFYVCRACKRFKGFVVKNDGACTPHGHSKVLYDDDGDRLFCARKNPTAPAAAAAAAASRKQRNKEVRAIRKGHEALACRATELVPVNLDGYLLQCYNKVYVLCPACGRPTVFDFRNVHVTGMFICGPKCPGRNDTPAAATATATAAAKCLFCDASTGATHGEQRLGKPFKIKTSEADDTLITVQLCTKHDLHHFHRFDTTNKTRNDVINLISVARQKKFG